MMEFEATFIRPNRYAVAPKGCIGTCGWHNGVPWTVVYVKASNKQHAIRKAIVIMGKHEHLKCMLK